MEPYFLGIDIGTQGTRVVLIDAQGNLIGRSERVFPLNKDSREEQSPILWWEACTDALKETINGIRLKIDVSAIVSISVTSTSGTVIPLDGNNNPLHNALMYSDKRSGDVAEICKREALKSNPERYTGFNSSSGLSKIVWFMNEFPDKTKKIHRWVHAADYITGKLSGRWGITDYTNALKTGYDVLNFQWPAYLFEKLQLSKDWLPSVVPSGQVLGNLEASIARELNLPTTIKVTAGITDGCASQIASGAMNPGDWNTTIGTTMVIKGVTRSEVKDPQGRIYSHRHPEGFWMPGGASNTGADWVANEFGQDLEELSAQAETLIPSGFLAYPLRQKGERFPFIAPTAKGFEPKGLSRGEKFTANMEGVAYLERYAYELIEKLSGEKINAIFTAGGGSNNAVWLKIRSSVMNLPIYRMKHVSGAVGAAILAASRTHFGSITESAKALARIDCEIEPISTLSDSYKNDYHRFIEVLSEKGYIN